MARIVGSVRTEWLKTTGKDRLMRLLEDFCFEDDNGIIWGAKAGAIIDGASIPKYLWSIVGDPFIGDYRRASVIHDVHCKAQVKTHEAVHRMFYDLMIADGVDKGKAGRMYWAVKTFGPKWETIQE